MTEDMCMYCENPAELTLIDSATKRIGSGGNNVKLGSGHPMPACRPCGDRLAARYGLKEAGVSGRTVTLNETTKRVETVRQLATERDLHLQRHPSMSHDGRWKLKDRNGNIVLWPAPLEEVQRRLEGKPAAHAHQPSL